MRFISMIILVENGSDSDLNTFYVSHFQPCLNVHSIFMILMISMILNRMNKMVGNVFLHLKTFLWSLLTRKVLQCWKSSPPLRRTKTNRRWWIFQENDQLISSSREDVTSSRDAHPAPPRPWEKYLPRPKNLFVQIQFQSLKTKIRQEFCMYYISMHPCLTAVGKFINIYPDSDFEGLLVVGELLSVLQKFPV